MKKNLFFPILILCFGVSSLHAQIKVLPNGTVHAGNTTMPLFDANTRFEVNVPKAVIKSQTTPNFAVGFQFIPSTDPVSVLNVDVMALTGLTNKTASIGRSNNQMNRVFSAEYFSSSPNPGIQTTSDAKLKTNIRELSSMTERISKLRPVMYDFIRDGSGEDVSKNPAYQNRVGFIAQEVKELFPNLIVIYKLGDEEDAEEIHSLDYAGLIPYLTKTIQELNEKVEKLQQQINFAANFDIDMTPSHAPQQATQAANDKETHILHQNVPNPFNSVTTINYHLADNVKDAKICIYNLTGKQLQCYNLPITKGENTIEVRASSLQLGMYLYSLIVDGRLIDTKRMILTE